MEQVPPHSITAISAKRKGGKKVPKQYRKYHKKHKEPKDGGAFATRAVFYLAKALEALR